MSWGRYAAVIYSAGLGAADSSAPSGASPSTTWVTPDGRVAVRPRGLGAAAPDNPLTVCGTWNASRRGRSSPRQRVLHAGRLREVLGSRRPAMPLRRPTDKNNPDNPDFPGG